MGENKAQVMEGADGMYKKYFYREKLYLVQAAKHMMSVLSQSKLESLLEHAAFRIQSMSSDMYRLFMLERLQKFHIGISKLLKDTVIVYLSSDTILIRLIHTKNNLTNFYKSDSL